MLHTSVPTTEMLGKAFDEGAGDGGEFHRGNHNKICSQSVCHLYEAPTYSNDMEWDFRSSRKSD